MSASSSTTSKPSTTRSGTTFHRDSLPARDPTSSCTSDASTSRSEPATETTLDHTLTKVHSIKEIQSSTNRDPPAKITKPNPTGMLSIASLITGPYIRRSRVVNVDEIDIIAKTTYRTIVAKICLNPFFVSNLPANPAIPKNGDHQANRLLRLLNEDRDRHRMLTEAQFVNACRYAFRARCDLIYSHIGGKRLNHRIAMPRQYILPKAVADCINQYGATVVADGAFMLYPHPVETAGDDHTQTLGNIVSHDTREKFFALVKQAATEKVINEGALSSFIEGAWLLTVRDINNASVVATAETKGVRVYSQFCEWTPADGINAAVLRNGYDGVIYQGHPDLYFQSDGLPDIRSTVNRFVSLT
uniref:Uncharacterized protein n=1 Tax=Panagrolaimus sp. ES5 TaxID=591445 RepID=A0AC34FKQ5_9BILA